MGNTDGSHTQGCHEAEEVLGAQENQSAHQNCGGGDVEGMGRGQVGGTCPKRAFWRRKYLAEFMKGEDDLARLLEGWGEGERLRVSQGLGKCEGVGGL